MILEDKSAICPQRIGEDFHTYPYLARAKKKYKELGKQVPIDDVLKQEVTQSLIDMHKEKGITGLFPTVPAYKYTLNAILHKCITNKDAATCVGSDLEKNKIECWTPNDTLRKGQCARAIFELRKSAGQKKEFFPKKWIIPLFDKEQITL